MSNVSCSLDHLSSVQMSMAFSPFILFLLAEHGQGVIVIYLCVKMFCYTFRYLTSVSKTKAS